MKQTAKGFMFMEFEADGAHGDYEEKWRPRWKEYRLDEDENRIYIGEMDVEFDVPDDFNPIPSQVAALEREKADALAQYTKTVGEINDRLSKLLAITHEVPA